MDSSCLLNTNIKYFLYVAKSGIANKLEKNFKYSEKNNCALLSGFYYHDKKTLNSLINLAKTLDINIYVLADSDPEGYKIYSYFKTKYEKSYFIGSLNKEISESRFETVMIKLNKQEDLDVLNKIKNNNIFQSEEWKKEIESLLKRGKKVELEGLMLITPNFDQYLINKIQSKIYI